MCPVQAHPLLVNIHKMGEPKNLGEDEWSSIIIHKLLKLIWSFIVQFDQSESTVNSQPQTEWLRLQDCSCESIKPLINICANMLSGQTHKRYLRMTHPQEITILGVDVSPAPQQLC